ncbi:fused MFS/spermidine synthase [Jannaschia seohaensis]|uniref:Predicted spermidine synthase with an N-terminal membrane domain n=1 Tax=Jannaschia seohaensis TaxID=475081 RepID=A0A2Y9AZB4_9RHOB|nr:fused MFS/spermidine synthase [Jannaschia seohaensis]PWJ15828.1 putative membrane-bound spermidine synthase [Jannaschia seohaensis]SSA49521.1 Predicted spermidine synthase with an N-terminal membrane domain [Jannaschia seohaensis]
MRFWTAIGLILVLSATGLTYEIAAGRVLAPFFGTSLLTWTAVIAIVLAGFSLGNALGGLIAERERGQALRTVRAALIATAVLAALSPTILGLVYALGARGTGGMLLAVFLAFFPASVLVSAPSPLLATLAVEARPGREASSLGLVLAAGSLGAILGAVLAGFVALPLIGSAATFAGCAVLALLCVPFLRSGDKGGPGHREATRTFVSALLPLGLILAATSIIGPVCRFESGLSCIDVARRGGEVSLYSDGIRQAAERVGPDGAPDDGSERLVLPYTDWIWDRMVMDLGPAPSVLFIGGGGYSLPTQLLSSRPEAAAIAVEIDPLITDVVRQNMPWAGDMIERVGYDASSEAPQPGQLGIVHADGRVYLNETGHRFDAAVMDAFSSASVPAHLVTLETFEQVRRVVHGPVYVNLIDAPDGPLARGTHAILSRLYPHVVTVRGPLSSRGTGNVVMAASSRPLEALPTLPEEYERARITPGRAFTDDRGWVGYR